MIGKIAFIALLILASCSSFKQKEQKSEIQIFSEKIAQNPTDIDLLYSRVDYNRSKNELESALFDLTEIVRLDSLDANNHYNIAEVYFELSKVQNPNPKYPSLVKYHLEKAIKIDHHPNEDQFGDLMIVDTAYSSASELVTHIAVKSG